MKNKHRLDITLANVFMDNKVDDSFQFLVRIVVAVVVDDIIYCVISSVTAVT